MINADNFAERLAQLREDVRVGRNRPPRVA